LLKDRSPRRRPEAQSPRGSGPERGFRLSVPWRLVVALVPVILVAGGTYAVLQSSLLTVQNIAVRGTVSLDQASLAEISGLQGKSMLTLSDEGARRRLMAIPAVYAVGIEREWPDTVVITVVERRPVAYWSVDGHDFPVDQEGVVLSGGEPEGRAPRIVENTPGRILNPGDRVHPDAVAFAQRIMTESPRFLEATVAELEYEPRVGVTVIFDSGLRVTFGDDRSYDYKIAVLSALLQELDGQGVQPRAVDLRFGERVTYE
jgi:cell division protein FtsQ